MWSERTRDGRISTEKVRRYNSDTVTAGNMQKIFGDIIQVLSQQVICRRYSGISFRYCHSR
jgi:hypothetical protein